MTGFNLQTRNRVTYTSWWCYESTLFVKNKLELILLNIIVYDICLLFIQYHAMKIKNKRYCFSHINIDQWRCNSKNRILWIQRCIKFQRSFITPSFHKEALCTCGDIKFFLRSRILQNIYFYQTVVSRENNGTSIAAPLKILF